MRFSTRATIGLATVSAALAAGVLQPAMASAQPASHQQSAVSPFFAHGLSFFGSFNAVSDAGGANPSGQVSYSRGFVTLAITNGTVVCLSVSGNTAVIGFRGTVDFPPAPRPVVGELVVADNGPFSSGLDTVGFSERDPATGPPNCSAPGSVQGVRVGGDVIVLPALGRMVGKGSILGGSEPASYAYVLGCDAAANARAPFELRFNGRRFRLTGIGTVSCTDDPAVPTPAAGFDTMTGTGSGTLTGGVESTIRFKFIDGGLGGANDRVELAILERMPTRPIFQGTAAPPFKFPGSDQATGNNTAQAR